MTDAAIRIQGVGKSFGSTRAVRDLDVVIPRGSLCGFLGPNGAGKSTTIRMIMSIIYPDTGSIDVLGSSALENKDRIGYLPEERGVYRKMRVGDFLDYVARLKGVEPHGLRDRIRGWLERVELPEVERQKCEELSKGMQQKVQFIASVIHDPELLILDEPFSGLDPVNADLVHSLIQDLHDAGTTIIFSTHVLAQAESICDRILLINRGVKLLDATLEEIRAEFDPRSLVAEPLGDASGLHRLDGVTNVRPLDGGPALELDLAPDADPHALMQAIIAEGPVRRLELRRLTLEEVFVQLVMKDLGAEAAIAAREELAHA